jgi:hypothetical protein
MSSDCLLTKMEPQEKIFRAHKQTRPERPAYGSRCGQNMELVAPGHLLLRRRVGVVSPLQVCFAVQTIIAHWTRPA